MFRGDSMAAWLLLSCGALMSACGTVDLGDNYVAPAIQLDEDFFYCRIQPEVLTAYGCATGNGSEGGMCHNARSALRLADVSMGNLPQCDDEKHVLDPIPMEATDNLEALQFTVYSSAENSPLYLRPLGIASHPRVIFPGGMLDPGAVLIREWIASGGQ